MKKKTISVFVAILLLGVLASIAYASNGGVINPSVRRDVAKVRKATEKYHDVNKAIADGYMPSPVCDENPGVGGMGYHYVNPTLAMDPKIDLTTPEILLYAPSSEAEKEDGKTELDLVGVEYFYGIGAPDTQVPNPAPPAPILFGLPFDGPMLGHIPGMPPHYDLHVWIWRSNPSGIFAPWNPKVSCK